MFSFLDKNKTYFFIGIKGSGMAALAIIFKEKGLNVIGSDTEKYVFSEEKLKKHNIEFLKFDEKNIKNDYIIIQGNSFNDDHEEVKKAKENKNKIYKYYQVLEMITSEISTIGISGSHGKTTVTSIVTQALNNKVNYLIGDGNGHFENKSDMFILEACEYRNHFDSYHLDYLIVTNIDFDHPDYFKDLNHVVKVFEDRINKTNKLSLIYGDEKYYKEMNIKSNYKTFGFDIDNDYVIKDLELKTSGLKFKLINNDKSYEIELPVYGKHMALNMAAVLSLMIEMNYDLKEVISNLKSYNTPKRRMETTIIDSLEQIIIDDSAHHPNEINAIIESVRQKYPEKKIVIIHQPHTYSRTKSLLNEFSQALSNADEIFITKLYGSPREKKQNISEQNLIEITPNSKFLDFSETYSTLKKYTNSVLLFVSIGDIWKYKDFYLENIKD